MFKCRLNAPDVDEHLDLLGRFVAALPEYADKQLHVAVAAMGAAEDVGRYAEKQGLYALVQANDVVVLRSQPGLEPRTWERRK